MKQIIAQEKGAVNKIISPLLDNTQLNNNENKRKKTELVDFGKFVVTSGLNIEILPAPYTIPDLMINWNGETYAVEHTAVIDQVKKVKAEKTDNLIRKAQAYFINAFGDLPYHIRFSLKFEVTDIYPRDKKKMLQKLLNDYRDLSWSEDKLMANAHPGHFTRDDLERVAREFSICAYESILNPDVAFQNDYINYLSISPNKSLLFTRSAGWSAGAIDQQVISAIREKEKNIAQYRINSGGLKQFLFLVVHGSNGYSDYASFDQNILNNEATAFDKVVFFNFFSGEYFILK